MNVLELVNSWFLHFFGLNADRVLIILVCALIFTFFAIKIHKILFKNIINNLKPNTIISKVLHRVYDISFLYYFVFVVYVGYSLYNQFETNNLKDHLFFQILSIVFVIYTVVIATRFIDIIVTLYLRANNKAFGRIEQVNETAKSLITFLIIAVVSIFTFFWILSILGINATSILAGAGVTAIILGFSLQNVLSDLFSSLSIFLDRPFEVGDTIALGNGTDAVTGTVNKIGFKSTRIRLLHGEELSVPNPELTKLQIRNFNKLDRRRVEMVIKVDLATPIKQIKQVPGIISDAVKKFEETDVTVCALSDISHLSYEFTLVYYLNSSDYYYHVHLKEKILLEIIEQLNKNSIELAFKKAQPTVKVVDHQ